MRQQMFSEMFVDLFLNTTFIWEFLLWDLIDFISLINDGNVAILANQTLNWR